MIVKLFLILIKIIIGYPEEKKGFFNFDQKYWPWEENYGKYQPKFYFANRLITVNLIDRNNLHR